MRIQDLAIIFIIIILPISIVLGAYTQMQISTISLQTEYDMKLIAATSDAIKAFQINTANSSTSDIANSKIRDIEASVSTFKASIKSVFGMNGYSEDEMNEYIPALVYTMYDGFYIYSRFNNQNYLYEVDENGNATNNPLDKNGENVFGLKPYISYSVKYNPNSDLDIVITYSLDNYISIKGMVKVDGEKQYWDKSGYLIDGIKKDASGKITYNGVEIDKNVVLSEDLPAIGSLEKGTYKYVRYNGTKYYLDERNARVIYFLNGNLMEINPTSDYDKYKDMIEKGESLSEELPQIGTLARGNYKYIVYNGTKYYLDERNTRIIYFFNGNLMEIKPKLDDKFVNPSTYPVDAAKYIKENLDVNSIKLFNEYNYGSYLLFEGIPVFIDSRADLYAPEFNGVKGKDGKYEGQDIFSDYINTSNISKYYENTFNTYGITHVILYKNSKLNIFLSRSDRYKELYSDKKFVIYERD